MMPSRDHRWSAFAAALLPVLALIALGYALKRIDFLPAGAWAGLEKLTYFVLFPALIVHTLESKTSPAPLGGAFSPLSYAPSFSPLRC